MTRFLASTCRAGGIAVVIWALLTCGTVQAQHGGFRAAPGATEEAVPYERRTGVDWSGLEQFWRVADTLSAGEAPSDAAWSALFDTPGYYMLSRRYPFGRPIRLSMELTFDPGQRAERDRTIASRVWMKPRMIRHLQRVKSRRDALLDYQQALQQDDDFVDDAVRAVSAFLPDSLIQNDTPPLVSFVLFLDDGFASEDVVAIDLLMARSLGREALVRFLAHEFFHAYRSGVVPNYQVMAGSNTELLLATLQQLENEGIADRIDKPALVNADPSAPGSPLRDAGLRDYAADYRRNYADAPSTLRRLDALLSRLDGRDGISSRVARPLQRLLPMGGHPTGAYVAAVINDELGRDALIATVGNVFAFLDAYHRAAQRHPTAPPFSDAALRVLDRLESGVEG